MTQGIVSIHYWRVIQIWIAESLTKAACMWRQSGLADVGDGHLIAKRLQISVDTTHKLSQRFESTGDVSRLRSLTTVC